MNWRAKVAMMKTRKPCKGCGKKRGPRNQYCKKCRAHLKKTSSDQIRRRDRRHKEGKCYHCEGKATVGGYCKHHWLCNTSYNHTGSNKNHKFLQKLWDKQEGRCAYTGVKLIPGKNASVDHKKPDSKGGRGLRNLQWVTKKVNRMKTDLSHSEFISLCKRIAKRFS